ncbi:MAG TPA: hypothetical protein VGM56_00325 [Byssovorax sp.]|jgi:signal transduction histidine kinase
MTDDRLARSIACPGGEGLDDDYVASVAAVELVRAIAQVLSTPVEALVRNLDDAEIIATDVSRGLGAAARPLGDRLRAARWSADRLDRVTRALDAVARFRERSLVPLDLEDVLCDAEALVRATAGRRDVIACACAPSRPVLADPTRLVQTVARLLQLAVEYVADAASRPVDVRVFDGDDGPTLEILARRDDDRGPPRSALAELDVVLCRHLVGLHGGRLDITARGGVLTAHLVLPPFEPVVASDRQTSRPRSRDGDLGA